MTKYDPNKPLVDTVSFRLPDTAGIKAELKTLHDSSGKKNLEIEADVTHGGYVNKNGYFYKPTGQAKSVVSFFRPFPKPVLVHHEDGNDPVGRNFAAAFIPLPAMIDKETKNDTTTPKSKVRIKAIITDQKAIEKILDKRYLTISTGSSAKTPPQCSICHNPVNSDDCTHSRGEVYEDNQKCYWLIDEVDYKEWSFENMPADATDEHVAKVTTMRLVEYDVPPDTDIHDFELPGEKTKAETSLIKDGITKTLVMCGACKKQVDYGKQPEVCMGAIKCPHCKTVIDQKGAPHSTDSYTGGSPMDQKDFDALVAATFLYIDECQDCGDEATIRAEWTDAAEIAVATTMDAEYTEISERLFADKAISPDARKTMKEGTFCGPNKTFPVPDCKHVSTAMAYLNFPATKTKYSAAVRARIASCVRGKAKSLGCSSTKKDSADLAAQLADAAKQVTALTDETTKLKTDLQGKDAQITEANTKITDLHKQTKRLLAEKIIDLSVISHRASIKDLVAEKNADERTKKYTAMADDLLGRNIESLTDTIKDLNRDVCFAITDFERVADPTMTQPTAPSKTEKKTGKLSVSDRLFHGIDEAKLN